MTTQVCEHLRPVEDDRLARGCSITFAGKAWSLNCRPWVYFNTVLDCDPLRKKFKLGESVTVHENDDPRSGMGKGLAWGLSNDAIIGFHPSAR